jgi:hypothetical protein
MPNSKNPGPRPTGSFDSKLLSYAIAGGAALLSPAAGHAGIIYSGTVNQSTSPILNLDLNADTLVDYIFTGTLGSPTTVTNSVDGGSNGVAIGTTGVAAGVDVAGLSFQTSAVLNTGTVSPGYCDPKIKTCFKATVTNNGPLPVSTPVYLGLSFDISGQTHYGWAQISTTMLGTTSNTADSLVTVIDYAYETTPGASLLTGQTVGAPTPEPSSLALFALGAAGIAALRRRRKA